MRVYLVFRCTTVERTFDMLSVVHVTASEQLAKEYRDRQTYPIEYTIEEWDVEEDTPDSYPEDD